MDELELTRKLISIDSVDSKPTAVRFLQKLLGAEGIKTRILTSGGVESLLAFKGKGRPILMLNGHYDTVPAGSGWLTPPFKAVERGGRLYGLGAADMKAGLAAMTAAFIEAQPAHGTLVLAAVGDEEEGGRRGSGVVVSKLRPDFVVVGEPTSLDLALGHKAVLQLEVSFKGKSAHAAQPTRGDNAITRAAAMVNELAKRYPVPKGAYGTLFDKTTMNVGTISGGRATNVVADACSLTLDFRIPPRVKHKAVLDEVRRIARRHNAQVRVIEQEPGWLEPADSSLVKMARKTLGDIRSFKEFRKLGANDGRYFASRGARVVNVGPADPRVIHAPNESVPLREVSGAKRFYQTLVSALLG